MKTHPIKPLLLFFLLFVVIYSCEKNDSIIKQEKGLKTVAFEDAQNFIKQIEQGKNKTSGENFITSFSEDISYEDLTNTEEELAVIPVTTLYPKLYSRLVLLTIDNKIQSAVVSLNPFEDATPTSFSGELLITDREGNIQGVLVIEKNAIVAEYKHNGFGHKSHKSDTGKTTAATNCWCGLSNCDWCGELDEVIITADVSDTPPVPYVSISYIYTTDGGGEDTNEWDLGSSGGGYADLDPDSENDKPCPGDPVNNPEIVSSGASGKKGGTFGCTRQGDTDCSPPFDKEHDGMDIKAELDTNVYAMYSGKVSNIRDSFSPGQYQIDSYGNYVIITFQINGNTYFAKYNHLNTVSLVQGQSVVAGDIIGTAGNTGNAASAGVTPHIHLQVFNSSWQSINPSDFLNTKYDNNHNPISNCN
ncbi:M23 family metallopeptidase [Psychroflexus sp. YR1-1]|uniref:M23 family metallopeptidase n=1 Tax=Psychroflexus aurantiacus TaxID=2709310 RepID=A0A6B3RBG0_9FLAO|nr:M23 family metallopeptidase [Psychroflexus aurantiacus]NEV94861.1 M23 family metallopeptidase [Psychroflexus aurantiacus]